MAYTLLLLLLIATCVAATESPESSIYIVHLRNTDQNLHPDAITEYHHEILASHDIARESMVYSYRHALNGFAARFTKEQAARISQHHDVQSVFPSRRVETYTTRSWDYMSMGNSQDSLFGTKRPPLRSETKQGEDVIIGLVDTGIWPEAQNFHDDGMSAVPKRWKGICQEGEAFNSSHCNRKLIGARYFYQSYLHSKGAANVSQLAPQIRLYISARDDVGHGTHTSSIAAGRYVPNASLFGLANGTAVGGAPKARLAMYKVLWGGSGDDADVTAGIDAAVEDGVDIISMSLGGRAVLSFKYVGSFIAALGAVEKGVVVVTAAGNDGPDTFSVSNSPPWMITVGASADDRTFKNNVTLGNGVSFKGLSFTLNGTKDFLPLVSGDAAGSSICRLGALDPVKVRNNVVVCEYDYRYTPDPTAASEAVLHAGGAGVIYFYQDEKATVDGHLCVLPCSSISATDAQRVLSYISSTSNPAVNISPVETTLATSKAPVVATFSGRGPGADPNVVKPDIVAPGVDILAAYSPVLPVEPGDKLDRRRTSHVIFSGTSMACPHIAGIVALLKSHHPDWSPAAILSAIVTTGYKDGMVGNPFDFGGGHVNPNAALHPGLVYDLLPEEYVRIRCDAFELYGTPGCGNYSDVPLNVNYPSIARLDLANKTTITRNVTNVEEEGSVYRVTVISPPGYSIQVEPQVLRFDRKGATKTFQVTMEATSEAGDNLFEEAFGSITWSDGLHDVTSPVALVRFANIPLDYDREPSPPARANPTNSSSTCPPTAAISSSSNSYTSSLSLYVFSTVLLWLIAA